MKPTTAFRVFLPAILLASCTQPDGAGLASADLAARMADVESPALRLHGFRESFEIAPVLLAADRYFPAGISIKRGGIPNLFRAEGRGGYGDPGLADVATHAETQLLRYSLERPDLRTIMTVTEGLYRIVARRSAGIERPADLKSKRIATLIDTSAGFFLQKLLEREGLGIGDVVLVDLPLDRMGEALAEGTVDALSIWEPEAEEGARALGADLIEFSGEGIYREIFNLNSTAATLADPEKRAQIKDFLRAIIRARREIERDPSAAQSLVQRMSGHAPELVEASWPHQRYVAGKVPDLLDVLAEEEAWLARRDRRPARSREELAKLIDYSLLDEVLAEETGAAGQSAAVRR